jgi:SAM-dependent methyltransferase
MGSSRAASRYVDDVAYVRAFIPELSPAWLDFTALLWGFAPVDRTGGFAWCDLGCGQGVNAAVFAATHPAGRFHGVDFLPEHIDHARGLARAAGVQNATFHAADFGAGVDLDLPPLDYITAHGVYSWVDDRARQDLRRFVERHLKPGGRVYVSYNALPGRTPDAPFQRLMLELGQRGSGDSAQRVRDAAGLAGKLLAMKTPALTASRMAQILLGRGAKHSERYLAHELMGANWRPLSVLDVRADMAGIGLEPAGSASLIENFDDFVLGKAARKLLAKVDDPDLHELVRDYLTNQSFRRDVFVRGGMRLSEAERRRRLLETPFALAAPRARTAYNVRTPAGEIKFDNPVARRMVSALAKGPRRLGELAGDGVSAGDILANAMILAGAQAIWPVDPGAGGAEAFNRAVFDRLGGPDELKLLALDCGTALAAGPALLAALKVANGDARGSAAAWRRHFAAYGAVAA